MKRELALYQYPANYKELQEAAFLGTFHNFDLFSTFVSTIKKIADFVPTQKLSAIVDYPYGNSPTSLRLHEISLAVRNNINIIDLVINNSFIENDDYKSFREDIKACKAIAKQNQLTLRAVCDYRLFHDEKLLEFCNLLKKYGITEIITTTGMVADDILDNLIVGGQLKNLGFTVVLASNMWNPTTVSQITGYKFDSIRFFSPGLVRSILGSY
jgi:deoxyribose-phosphate aldolase